MRNTSDLDRALFSGLQRGRRDVFGGRNQRDESNQSVETAAHAVVIRMNPTPCYLGLNIE